MSPVPGWEWMGKLTWTCMVCGEERPDAQISVHSIDITAKAGLAPEQGQIHHNVRYCNDRPACREGTVAWSDRHMVGLYGKSFRGPTP